MAEAHSARVERKANNQVQHYPERHFFGTLRVAPSALTVLSTGHSDKNDCCLSFTYGPNTWVISVFEGDFP